MQGPFSQIEIARRDTLLSKAEGSAFDSLAKLYGIPRLAAFKIKAWRKGALQVAFGARGTLGTTHAFLEGIFSESEKDLTFQVRLYKAQPQLVGYVSGGPFGGFKKQHVGRFIRIDSSLGSLLHWTKGPSFVNGGPLQSALTLVPFRSAYWAAADYSKIADADLDEGQIYQTATATILPFDYSEASPGPVQKHVAGKWYDTKLTYPGYPCKFRLFLDQSIATVPGSYFQSSGAALPDGVPYGGQLPASAAVKGDNFALFSPDANDPAVKPGRGPFPIYLGGDNIPGIADTLDLLLPAGVKATATTRDFAQLA